MSNTTEKLFKVTNLEAGVSIVESGERVFKISKLRKEWAIIFNGKIVQKTKTKKEALELLKRV